MYCIIYYIFYIYGNTMEALYIEDLQTQSKITGKRMR